LPKWLRIQECSNREQETQRGERAGLHDERASTARVTASARAYGERASEKVGETCAWAYGKHASETRG